MDETLIDEIYEAAFIPEKWESVLDRLASASGCDKAAMYTTNGVQVGGWVANAAIRPAMTAYIEGGWMERNTLVARAIQLREASFRTYLDLFSMPEMDNDPYFVEFLRPQGLGWGAGTILSSPSGDVVNISLHRPFDQGPIDHPDRDRLTQIRPHLGRATLASARLRLEEAKNTVSTLGDLGLPAAALSLNGKLRAANEAFATLMPQVAADFEERLRFTHRGTDILFANALARGNAGARAGMSFPVPKGVGDAPMVLHLMPIRRAARDIFTNLQWLLIAIPVSHSGSLDTRLLEGLFDLTPTEARVAKGILFGKSISTIAREHAVSPETARSQLKAVLAKTGTNRQGELASLLAGLKSPVSFAE